MKRCMLLLVAAVAVVRVCAATPDDAARTALLWPSERTVAWAQPGCEVKVRADGAAAVTTGTVYEWPGARLEFTDGERDFSRYGCIRVAVSNTASRPLLVQLSVKCAALQGQSPYGNVTLMPNTAGVIEVPLQNMPWKIDGEMKLKGMRGQPDAQGGSGSFDIRRVNSLHVFLGDPRMPGSFVIEKVALEPGHLARRTLKVAEFFPFVDRFGQFKHDNWPGKIHSDDELAAARAAESDWLARHAEGPIPGADRFGGWGAGPQLAATGFFRTEKVDGKWWLVDPDGHLFYSHGVDCVPGGAETGVTGREEYFDWLPEKGDPVFGGCRWRESHPAAHGFYKKEGRWPYDAVDFAAVNRRRKYGADWQTEVADLTHRRMRAWGLNTIANWSSPEVYNLRRTPYTVCLGTRGPEIQGSLGWWGRFRDPFAKEFEDHIARVTAKAAEKTGTDPWCVGWFVDNELSWGSDNRELARAVLRSPADQPAKAAFKNWLADKYADIAALNAVWRTDHADWASFLASTTLPDESVAGADLNALHRLVVAKYFRTVRDAIKQAAPNRLYLGARIAWGDTTVYEESARYCDVVSVNIYQRAPERDLPSGAADKPMIVGEFHFGALDRGMFHTGLVATRDQRERADCYRAYHDFCLRHPRYVGAHWFQWSDQALTGRADMENYQIGFVSVTDTPYPELVEAARATAATMYETRYRSAR